MAWPGLAASCMAASAAINAVVHRLWVSIPLSCIAGPVLFLMAGSLLPGGLDPLAGLVLVFGQVVALPVAVVVAATFRSLRNERRSDG